MSAEIYSDNILVRRGRGSAEFLAVSMGPGDEYRPYEVCLHRYCLPGRCDTYWFDWQLSPTQGVSERIRFFTERFGPGALPKALALLTKDLDKPPVVKLLVWAVRTAAFHYGRQLVENLLVPLAPKSKSCRACKKALAQKLTEMRARAAARRSIIHPE